MRLELESVINTDQFIGKKVYVCAYQEPDLHSRRAVQNVHVTECIVAPMDEYLQNASTKKTIYHSKNALLKLTKTRLVIYNNPVQPYAYNASYHTWTKTGGINIFDDLDECKEHYISLLKS